MPCMQTPARYNGEKNFIFNEILQELMFCKAFAESMLIDVNIATLKGPMHIPRCISSYTGSSQLLNVVLETLTRPYMYA